MLTKNEFSYRGRSQGYDSYEDYIQQKLSEWFRRGQLSAHDVTVLAKEYLGA